VKEASSRGLLFFLKTGRLKRSSSISFNGDALSGSIAGNSHTTYCIVGPLEKKRISFRSKSLKSNGTENTKAFLRSLH
jgi:hypothetical protein